MDITGDVKALYVFSSIVRCDIVDEHCCVLRQIMRQLLGAVEFIHSQNIVHRDLKVCSLVLKYLYT